SLQDFIRVEPPRPRDLGDPLGPEGPLRVDVYRSPVQPALPPGHLDGAAEGVAYLRFSGTEFTVKFCHRPRLDAAPKEVVEIPRASADPVDRLPLLQKFRSAAEVRLQLAHLDS